MWKKKVFLSTVGTSHRTFSVSPSMNTRAESSSSTHLFIYLDAWMEMSKLVEPTDAFFLKVTTLFQKIIECCSLVRATLVLNRACVHGWVDIQDDSLAFQNFHIPWEGWLTLMMNKITFLCSEEKRLGSAWWSPAINERRAAINERRESRGTLFGPSARLASTCLPFVNKLLTSMCCQRSLEHLVGFILVHLGVNSQH